MNNNHYIGIEIPTEDYSMTKNTDFKIDEKVRVTKSFGYARRGDTGVVVGHGNAGLYVDVRIERTGAYVLMLPDEIEKVSRKPEPKFKAGDRVYFSGSGLTPDQVGAGTILSPKTMYFGTEGYRIQWDRHPYPQNHPATFLTALKPADDPRLQPKLGVFQKGDRAKVLDASGATYAVQGDIVTVKLVEPNSFSCGDDFLEVKGSNGQEYGMYARRFEFVSRKPEPKFKAGDRVRLDSTHDEFGTILGLPRDKAVSAGFGTGPRYDIKFDHVVRPQEWGESKIIALKPEDDPRLQPIREEFNLTGAYVADKAGLDALPVGAVIEEASGFAGVDVRIKLRRLGEFPRWFRMGLGGVSQFALPAPGAGEFSRRTWVVKHVPGEFVEHKAA